MQVFSREWFQYHQNKILKFANTKVGKYLLQIDLEGQVVHVDPFSYTVLEHLDFGTGRAHLKKKAFSGKVMANRVYQRAKYFWWGLHFIDWLALDRQQLVPNFGFQTLNFFTQSGDNNIRTTPSDSYVFGEPNGVGPTYNQTDHDNFAANTGGTTAFPSSTVVLAGYQIDSQALGTVLEYSFYRGQFAFDTNLFGNNVTQSKFVRYRVDINENGGAELYINRTFFSQVALYAYDPDAGTSVNTFGDLQSFDRRKFNDSGTQYFQSNYALVDDSTDVLETTTMSDQDYLDPTGMTWLGLIGLGNLQDGAVNTSEAGDDRFRIAWESADSAGSNPPYLEITYDAGFQISDGSTSWLDAETVQVNIGDDWKNAVAIQVNIGDVWRRVF